MNLAIPLADGIPPKLIFFAIFGGIWLLGAIFGKSKKTGAPQVVPPRRGPGPGLPASTPRQAQWQARVEQLAGAVLAPPPMPAKQWSRGKAKPQPVNVQQAAALARQAAQSRQSAAAAKPFVAPIARTATRNASSETARNLKLLLQRGGVREAVLLTEIFGPPLSMRE